MDILEQIKEFHEEVKLNNPLMGTETRNFKNE